MGITNVRAFYFTAEAISFVLEVEETSRNGDERTGFLMACNEMEEIIP